MTATEQVLAAARELVRAFASNDTEAYFAAFSEDASFVFHTCPQPLLSRAAYQALWSEWQADGFEVLSCTSSNPWVSLQGDTALFIHDVTTHLQVGGERIESLERETIVFRKQQEQGRWLACHEHLSAMPE
ncbi:MAG: nuclear transport factor 2 family protein [Pseudomonas sp.]